MSEQEQFMATRNRVRADTARRAGCEAPIKRVVDTGSGQGALMPDVDNADFDALEAAVVEAISRFLLIMEKRVQDPAGRGRREKDFLWWLIEPLERELAALPLLKAVGQSLAQTMASGMHDLQRRDSALYNRLYRPLGMRTREAVRRMLRHPRSEATMYQFFNERVWTKFAGSYASQSRFDQSGFGQYLALRMPDQYERIVAGNAAAWAHHIGEDGHRYESRAELILANLLHLNRHQLAYAPHPLLHFTLPGSRRSMQGDFMVETLHGREGQPSVYVVECWGRRLATDPRIEASDPYVGWTLMRRRFKMARRDRYPGELLEIEAEVLREKGPTGFTTHCVERFAEKGLAIATNGLVHVSRNCPTPDQASAEEIAHTLHRAGCRTVNLGIADSSRRVRALAYSAIRRRIVQDVEVHLAAFWGRPPRVRMARGTCASRELVEQYVRDRCLDKAGYARQYAEGSLPAGFPSSPRQQWPDWSWWKARGDGVPREELIRDYGAAKARIAQWQSNHGTIAGPSAYERARKAHRELHVLPLQPDNRKWGGLRGWVSWADFLAGDLDLTLRDSISFPSEAKIIAPD